MHFYFLSVGATPIAVTTRKAAYLFFYILKVYQRQKFKTIIFWMRFIYSNCVAIVQKHLCVRHLWNSKV